MARPNSHETFLVTNEETLRTVSNRLTQEPRVALDIESNGMHAYRAKLCVLQLAARGSVVIVDPLVTPIGPLAALLSSRQTVKLLHDVSFDARILAESGFTLENVKDTSVAARMLGRTATGLGSLLATELGIHVDKKMQHHDWAERPLDRAALTYLGNDVVHLDALADRLFAEVEAKGIADEVDEETRYRIAQAIASADAGDERPAYLRLKGIDRAPKPDLPILRRLADVREEKARELDVPPYKVLAPDVLFDIASIKPRTMSDLAKIRGATQGRRAASLADDILRAVESGLEEDISDADRAMLEKPRPPAALLRARRAREQRLSQWRRDEAQRRGVDEQVILPGHCLQDAADLGEASLEELARVPGIGAFRIERYGAALLAALATPEAPP